jgi:3-methyladenine DNA glycosylase AlkD
MKTNADRSRLPGGGKLGGGLPAAAGHRSSAQEQRQIRRGLGGRASVVERGAQHRFSGGEPDSQPLEPALPRSQAPAPQSARGQPHSTTWRSHQHPPQSTVPRQSSRPVAAPLILPQIRRLLRATAGARDALFLQRFFKTGPGQYGEGDRFLGVRVPAIRRLTRYCDDLTLVELTSLLHSPYHEERLLALLALVRRFARGGPDQRRRVFELYLRETRFINNWDLVDLSAPHVVGIWLLTQDRSVLDELAASKDIWRRRIAVLATLAFIRQGQFQDTLRLCRRLLPDRHDLMHKACGWMLREVGKRDVGSLRAFLRDNAERMPRTMLRYAIERLPEKERKRWLAVRPASRPSQPR